MACSSCDSGGGGCGSGCSCEIPLLPPRIEGKGKSGARTCVKCKERVAALAVGNQAEPMCTVCLHAGLLAKFKTAVNNNGLILPSDKVLVAFSGGPASRVALELLKEIRAKAQCDAGGAAGKDRGLKVFGLGAVFVDERTILPVSSTDAQAAVDEIRSILEDGDQQQNIPLTVVRLECIFDNDKRDRIKTCDDDGSSSELQEELQEARDRIKTCDDDASSSELQDELQKARDCMKTCDNDASSSELQEELQVAQQKVMGLFQSIQDSTGREDLLEYLRMQAIQKVAQEQGFTKVVLGLSTTRIAGRVLSATTKGRGFSLSADIQYLDARWPVPIILPLRDCVARELALFCYFSKFKTVFIKGLTTMADPRSSLNNLAHSFITLLQEENPSREQTIVRTAAKLKSFRFNEVVAPPNRRRKSPQASRKDTIRHPDLNVDLDILCSICRAPIDRRDLLNVGRTSSVTDDPSAKTESIKNSSGHLLEFRSTCCPSCCSQIFPVDEQKASELYGLLPSDIKERGMANFACQQKWMRSQIESYLLPEEDDD